MTNKKSKRHKENLKAAAEKEIYTFSEAVDKLKNVSVVKFDETVDIVFNLGIDPKKNDQQVRGSVSLPSGLGKKIKVAVITNGEKIKESKEAGADMVGSEDLIEKINGGFLEFDILLATPDMMPKVGKLGKVLGRRGLMPTPKAGTVTTDLKNAVTQFKAGKVEYKTDKKGIVQLPMGKVSFDNKKLTANYDAIYDALVKAKPSAAKGVYMKSICLSTSMGPSIKVAAK